MLRKLVTALILLAGTVQLANAQFYPTQYRPPNQNWQYLKTPHFKLIYSLGNDSSAYKMGKILEEEYSEIQNLVGGSLSDFPVILNDYNDLSNGFVTSLHFRSEIELPPIKGKAMNPKTGSWLENVGPHELVHAMQYSNLGDYNIPQLVNIFSPDLARSFHGAIPAGILEGLAVQHETEDVTPNGGRGNYPYFTNQFNATFDNNQRWSMGQLVHFSTDTRPLNRHYIGGYEFIAWLQNEFGRETSRNALDFYMDYPFLGYGFALRHVTGKWPNQLYDQFETDHEKELEKSSKSELSRPLNIPFSGSNIRRPKWLNDSTLVFYGSFYNARSGFYRYNLNSGTTKRFITTNSIRDFRYDISDDGSNMLFSYYEPDAIYDNTAKAELVSYNFETQAKEQITDDDRLYAPAFLGDDIAALQSEPSSSRLVFLKNGDPDKIIQSISIENLEIIAVNTDPNNKRLAIVANKRGLQGLWITNRENLNTDLKNAPDVSFEKGSIFDPEWHPTENRILFSSDYSGTLQLYELNLENSRVNQITNSTYNAFEGSYNSDGSRIAYIRQEKNERLPVTLTRGSFLDKKIDNSIWKPTSEKSKIMQRSIASDSINRESKSWETGTYSGGASWLKPRTILPVFDEIGNWDVYQMGLSFHSNNLMANQTYKAEVTVAENRGWYNFVYHNRTFYPGFKARLFSRPSYISLLNQDDVPITFLRQERSFALSVPFRYRIRQNIFNTGLYLEPEFRQSQVRFFDLRQDTNSDFANLSIGNIYGQFNYRLQQNIRDLQPNTGFILYGELEHYFSSGSANFGDKSRIPFNKPSALRGGLLGYFSPLRRWNQSLRIGIRGVTQTNAVFDNQSIVSNAFSNRVLNTSNNLLSFSTRYTVPLWYVDDGGFLLPFYLSNMYLVGFTNTVADPSTGDWYDGSRSVFGIGLRTRFRLSNLSLDIGIGYGYEPTRGNHQIFIGDF